MNHAGPDPRELRTWVFNLAHGRSRDADVAEAELDRLLAGEAVGGAVEELHNLADELDGPERRWLGSLLTSHSPSRVGCLLLHLWGSFVEDDWACSLRPRWPLAVTREQSLADDFFGEIGEAVARDWLVSDLARLVDAASGSRRARAAFAELAHAFQDLEVRALPEPVGRALIALLSDPVPRVREAACWALSRVDEHSPELIKALEQACDDAQGRVRAPALVALAAAVGAQHPRVVGGLSDQHPWARLGALFALERSGDRDTALRAAELYRQDPDALVRRAASTACLRLRLACSTKL